jgi:hypothetical protein
MDAPPENDKHASRIEYWRKYRQQLKADPEKRARVNALKQERYRRWYTAHAAERAVLSEQRRALRETQRAQRKAELEAERASREPKKRGRPRKVVVDDVVAQVVAGI